MTSSYLSNVGAMLYPLAHTSSANQMPGTRAYGVQSAALLALSQIGATNAPSAAAGAAAGATGTATAGATGSPAAAATGTATAGQSASNGVQTFLQSLYAALQAQAALDDSTPANAAGGASGASGSPTAAAVHGHHGHHAHHGRAELSSIVQQLGASASASSTADSSGTLLSARA